MPFDWDHIGFYWPAGYNEAGAEDGHCREDGLTGSDLHEPDGVNELSCETNPDQYADLLETLTWSAVLDKINPNVTVTTGPNSDGRPTQDKIQILATYCEAGAGEIYWKAEAKQYSNYQSVEVLIDKDHDGDFERVAVNDWATINSAPGYNEGEVTYQWYSGQPNLQPDLLSYPVKINVWGYDEATMSIGIIDQVTGSISCPFSFPTPTTTPSGTPTLTPTPTPTATP